MQLYKADYPANASTCFESNNTHWAKEKVKMCLFQELHWFKQTCPLDSRDFNFQQELALRCQLIRVTDNPWKLLNFASCSAPFPMVISILVVLDLVMATISSYSHQTVKPRILFIQLIYNDLQMPQWFKMLQMWYLLYKSEMIQYQ